MMAIEIAQGTVDDKGAYFRVEKHEWDFEDYRKDRTFNNSPTHYQHNKDNPYLIKGVQQVDANGNPIGRPIPEERQQRYKHIKVKEGTRISKAGNIALNEIVKVTGTDINTSPGPLQTPAKVAKRIKGTFTSVGEEVNRLLKKAQKVVWKKSQSMDIVDDIREHESVLHELMGVEELYKKDAEGNLYTAKDFAMEVNQARAITANEMQSPLHEQGLYPQTQEVLDKIWANPTAKALWLESPLDDPNVIWESVGGKLEEKITEIKTEEEVTTTK